MLSNQCLHVLFRRFKVVVYQETYSQEVFKRSQDQDTKVFFRGELGIRTVTYLVFTKARTNGECFLMDLNGRCLLLGTANAVFILFSAYRTKCSFMHGRCPLPRDHKCTSEVKCERDRRPFFPDE